MISHVGRRAVAAHAAAAENSASTTNAHAGFSCIKVAVAAQWERMQAHPLFRTGVDGDVMWDTYLTSFPPGSNPILRKRTEHDCSCCRRFIHAVGNVVAVIGGEPVSMWDVDVGGTPYQAVADAMSALVRAEPIADVFLHAEGRVGTDRNHEKPRAEGGAVKTWEHFSLAVPNSRVCRGVDIGPRLSEARASHDVLLRGLTELTLEAADTVLDLIDRKALYRGEEHRHAVEAFRQAKTAFDALAPADRDNAVWLEATATGSSMARIRNTAIGTLLVDLSQGTPLEGAVRKFEAMVAPANYKRPTALVTATMIEKAKATLAGLGLTSALDRRYATLRDVSIGNVLFADRSARKAMGGDVFDDLSAAAKVRPGSFDGVEPVGIEAFLADVLPGAASLELLVENRHAGRMVSLIAPADPAAGLLFKWPNRFSWSYVGDVADSIRERVKKAGGSVAGDLCCRLAWSNYDDLDLHMVEPGGHEIYYTNRGRISPCGGCLDVDMNGLDGRSREPVENIFYASASRMREGNYRLFVHQYSKNETKDVGFEAEIDIKGVVTHFAYDKPLRSQERVEIAQLRYSRAGGIEIVSALPSSTVSRKVWGVDTGTFCRAAVVMLSPNQWDGQGIGNRHWFFMLAGCRNDGSARGFYNEFLKGELDQHRKVFEMVGARMRTDESANQLSGLGFSSTQHDDIVARVGGGSTSRVVRVVF